MTARILALAISYICGISAATVFPVYLTDKNVIITCWIVFTVGIIFSAWSIIGEFRWNEYSVTFKILPIVLAALCLGNIRASSVLDDDSRGARFFKNLNDGQMVDLKGYISAEPQHRSESRLDLRLNADYVKKHKSEKWRKINGNDVKIKIYIPKFNEKAKEKCLELADINSYGYKIEASGVYIRPRDKLNLGEFDAKAFLMSEGYTASINVYDWRQPDWKKGKIEILSRDNGNIFMEYSLAAKRNFLGTFKRVMPSPEGRLISGATLGTRFALRGKKYKGKLIEESFRHAGVGHVLAVSGLHISVVSLLLYSLFRLTKMPPKAFAPVVILLLVSFALLTGARPSSLRATIMNSVIIISFVYGGLPLRKATFAGLAIASFIILLRRPMVLYSAGFLLSFGAVMSLVLLSPPIDKILKQLRGGVLILSFLWYLSVLIFACTNWVGFLQWDMLLLIVAALVVLIRIGMYINLLFPAVLAIRLDRIPNLLRIFISAQFAIQLGMMVPMSAYFFGNFPIAGMFVNFAAIPLVGILVQLGILIGIFGAIPLIGQYLALIFGAADYIFASFFIWIAHMGTEIFPFPPVPKPDVKWMLIYYACLAILLSLELVFPKIQRFIYKIAYKKSRIFAHASFFTILLLLGISVLGFSMRRGEGILNIDILAGSDAPVISITSDNPRDGAVIINGGSSFFGKSTLKSHLLSRKATFIEAAVSMGHERDHGSGAFSKLAEEFRINKIYYPSFKGSDDIFPDFKNDAGKFFMAIGDKYKAKQAAKEKKWALRYYEDYSKLRKLHKGKVETFYQPESFVLPHGMKADTLSTVYQTEPVVLSLKAGKIRILVINDPSSKSIWNIPDEKLRSDYLVFGGPVRFKTKYYDKGMEQLLKRISPEEVILCSRKSYEPREKYAYQDAVKFLKSVPNLKLYETRKSGPKTIKISTPAEAQ